MFADKFLCLLLGYKVQFVSYINKISGCGITILVATKDLINLTKIKDLMEVINGVLTLIKDKDRVSIREEINGKKLFLLIQIRVAANGETKMVVNGVIIFLQILIKEVNGEIIFLPTPIKEDSGEIIFPLIQTKEDNGEIIFLPIQIRAEINGEAIKAKDLTKVETNGEIKEETNGEIITKASMETKVLNGELMV
jgi:hypothetical protein